MSEIRIARPFHHIVDVNGKRRACFNEYNGGAEAAEKNRKPGERIESRACPFAGCPCSPDAHPPCGLCYE